MALVLAGSVLLALYVVPGVWGPVLIAAAVLLTAAEVKLVRSTRGLPPAAGVETMTGGRAVVVSGCHPAGRVRYGSESWKARCAAGADVGDAVVIDSVENTTLVVRPAARLDVPSRESELLEMQSKRGHERASDEPSQFEQENDLGRGGGEVDEETLEEAWREAGRRRGTGNLEDERQG